MRIHALFAAVACISLNAAAQTVPVDPDGFTDYSLNLLRAVLPAGSVVKVQEPLLLNADGLSINLQRPQQFCSASPQHCSAALRAYVDSVAAVLKQRDAPIDSKSVMLSIRDAAYLQRAQAAVGADGPAFEARPLADGVLAIAMLDTPRAARPLNSRDAQHLKLSDDQLFALAAENLRAALEPLDSKAKPVASGQIGTLRGGYHEAGRIALLADWAGLAAAQNGTLLVAAPATDVVLYISESSPTAVDALRTLARDIAAKSASPLSPAVLRWTAQRWIAF